MLINKRYELHEQLGHGGMGIVYRATDRLNGVDVALKRVLVRPDKLQFRSQADQPEVALAREFQMLAGLRHPHIISVLDYGFDEDGKPFFTMELLYGAPTLLEGGASLPVYDRVRLLIQLLQALAYLHRRGIVHRDLKPANVLLQDSQTVRVLDFGLATTDLQAGALAGTVAYLAPEAFLGEPLSVSSDLYAVGVIAYELLTGTHPFASDDVNDMIARILAGGADMSRLPALPTPSHDDATAEQIELETGLEPLELIIERLMALRPTARYESSQAVIHALQKAIGAEASTESSAIRESFLQAAAFVGREAELSCLERALRAAMRGQGSGWLVGGESGVGKSRLLDELRIRALVEDVLVLTGQGVEGGGLPYQLWRAPMRRLALTTPLDPADRAVLKELVPDIDAVCGEDVPDAPPLESKAALDRLISVILTTLRRQTTPVLLLLEDLQWAAESMEPLRRLRGHLAELPLLIVASYRDDERPHLPEELPGFQTLHLERLAADHIAALSASMLGQAGSQPTLIDFLQRETEGNVFFLVEVVRALAEEAGSLGDVGAMRLPQHVLTGGIERIVERRLGRVAPVHQPLLKLAAVAGRAIDTAVLGLLTDDLTPFLTACANAAVLEVREGQWRFCHDQLRQAVLAGLDATERPGLHRRVALATEAVHLDDENYASLLAEHWRVAHNPDRECRYQKLAARQSYRLNQYRTAIQQYERALTLERVPQRRIELLVELVRAYDGLSEFPPAEKRLDEALALAQRHPEHKVRILRELGWLAWRQSQYDRALTLSQEALTLARQRNDAHEMAYALRNLGAAEQMRGNLEVARRHLEDALVMARRAEDGQAIAIALANLGLIAYYQQDFATADHYYQQGLAYDRANGDRRGLAAMLNNLGNMAQVQGDYAAARAYISESLELNRDIGNRQGEARCLMNLGIVAVLLGQPDAARDHYQRSRDISRELGDQWGIAATSINLGHLSIDLDDRTAAWDHFRQGLVEARQLEALPVILDALVGVARLLMTADQPVRAAHLVGLALHHPATIPDVQAEADPILMALRGQLPDLETHLRRGQTLDLDQVLDDILDAAD